MHKKLSGLNISCSMSIRFTLPCKFLRLKIKKYSLKLSTLSSVESTHFSALNF